MLWMGTVKQLVNERLFELDSFIAVEKNTVNFINESTVIERDMVIALCHNVTIKLSDNSTDSFLEEHGTFLFNSEKVKRFMSKYFIIDQSTRELREYTTAVTEDMWLLLAHQVKTSGATNSVFFVESGQQLNTNKGLAELFEPDKYYNVTDATNGTPYSGTTRVYENMDVVIKDLCDTFSQDECVTTKGVCTWTRTGGCRRTGTFKDPDNKGLVIGVVVGGVAVVAGVVVCVVVVVVKHKKAHGMVEVAMGDAAMLNTGFANNSAINKTVSVRMDGKDTVLELVEEVGHGSYATVWRAHPVLGDDGDGDESRKKEYAVKVIDGRRSVGATEAQKEAMMMEELDTHFVVAVYGCGHTDRSMAIAMEYMPLGSLQNVLQQDKLPSNGRVPMLLDIAKAMAYLHSIPIIHRDLKPGNVLVCSIHPTIHPMAKFVSFPFFHHQQEEDRQVEREWNASKHTAHRITDFGEARTVESMEASMTMTSGVGTPFFMAPEMATGTKHYTGAVDVYSFAIMAAQVLSGRLVYDSSDSFDTSYGLCIHWSFTHTHKAKPKSTVCVIGLCFHLALVLCHPLPHTQRL